jgi:hypothetical protein
MTETPEQIVERLRAAREARKQPKAPQPVVPSGLTASDKFRARLEKHQFCEDGWLWDVNAYDLGITKTQAARVSRSFSKENNLSFVVRTEYGVLFFDPEDNFYRSLDHTNEPGWDFDWQREAMELTEDEARAVLNRWMTDHNYQI